MVKDLLKKFQLTLPRAREGANRYDLDKYRIL